MKRTLSLTIALSALSLTAACGTSTDDDPTTDGNNTSGGDDGALSRNGAPKPHDGISEDTLRAATTASLNGAIETMNATSAGTNSVVSPASLSYALAIANEGGQCETASEVNTFLGVSDEERAEVYDHLAWSANQDTGQTLALATALNKEASHVDEDSVKAAAEKFHSGYATGSYEELNATLNEWVDKTTDGQISELPSALTDDTAIVFTSAMFYGGAWSAGASKSSVDFTGPNGTENVDAIRFSDKLSAWEVDKGTIVSVPVDGASSTLAFLPDEGVDPSELRASDWELPDTSFDAIVTVPMVDISATHDVKKVQDEIGLPSIDVRDPECGFSGYGTEGSAIFVNVLMQEARVQMDEEGIMGSAVTQVEMAGEGAAPAPEQPKEIIFDRPYALNSVEEETGWSLLYTVVVDPNA